MQDIAIIGANGYSGVELCRIMAGHPGARIVALASRQLAGQPVAAALPRLAGHPGVAGLSLVKPDVAALLRTGAPWFFLALPHGLASEFAVPLVAAGCRVIDLSADFRLRSEGDYLEFYGSPHPATELLGRAVYGLPEIARDAVAGAELVASAGCYPTSVLLPLVPLLKAGLLEAQSLVVSSASGVSGAGRKAETPLLFGECNESLRAYGLPKHRHLSEIEQELTIAADAPVRITFVPHLAPMTRGIHTTIFAAPAPGRGHDLIRNALAAAYAGEPFVRVSDTLPDTKHVAGTNFCDISTRYDERTGRVILLCAIDNLVKGAAGQAVQNFNIMAGLPETHGLL
jgi:N-acetyl-gamma-glutamyl-phosphate reductase